MRLPSSVFEAAWYVDRRRGALARGVRRRLGVERPLRVLPYRGYGTHTRACIRARVLEHRDVPPPSERRTVVASAIASYRRYATIERAGVPVRARWGAEVFEGRTDDEGFLELWVPPPESAVDGWNDVRLELDGGESRAAADARVLVCPSGARFVVLSDVDDTVIDTGVSNLLRRAWALFLSRSDARVPFEGVGAFYEALRHGGEGHEENPIVYVSSSPYNLHEHIDEFLALHSIPDGPVLLRDWGLTRTGFAPGGGHGHKLAKIRSVMSAFPHLPLVLIGDSGQEDPEHYVTIATESPGRVLAIYIRDVTASSSRRAALDRLAETARAAGTALVHVPDTVTAARHAAAAGWIQWQEVDDVRMRRAEEREDGPSGASELAPARDQRS
ncbi:MAG: DUF2183 domain-containing protein [Myxococcota bacterium]|nr:DUF2183 domain-containing protein [Myxococcota bacterium]